MDKKETHNLFGTRAFKEKFNIIQSTQALLRSKGLPYYTIPHSTKILYCEAEVFTWLTSNRGTANDKSTEVKME